MFSTRLSATDTAGAIPARAAMLSALTPSVASMSRFRRTKAEGAAQRSSDSLTVASGLIGEMEVAPDTVLPAYGELGAIALGRTLNSLRDEVTAYAQFVQHLSDTDSGGARLLALRFAQTFGTKMDEARKLAERADTRVEKLAPAHRDAFREAFNPDVRTPVATPADTREIRAAVTPLRSMSGNEGGGEVLLRFNAQLAQIERQAARLTTGEREAQTIVPPREVGRESAAPRPAVVELREQDAIESIERQLEEAPRG
jgi:hypothetical protein